VDRVDHLGDRRARRQRSRVARRQPDEGDGGERAGAGGQQEHAAHTEPRCADQHAGERWGDHTHRLLDGLAQHDGRADLIRLAQRGDERDAGREVQRERNRLNHAGDDQHPVLDDVGEHRQTERQRRRDEHQHRGDQHRALGEAVSRDAAPRRGDQHRAAERQHHASQARIAAREVLGQPAAGDRLTHHPEDHRRRTDEKSAISR